MLDGRDRRAVIAEAAGEFLGEVHGIAHAAAVAAADHLATLRQGDQP